MKYFKVVFVLVFFILATYSNAQNLQKVSLQLNWKYQFEFAGFIAAYEKGFYKEAGLDVEIREYQDGISVLDEVQNGNATYGIYDLSAIEYYDKNKPLVLLANYLKKSALVFVAKQDIITPFDFKNKTIMAESSQLDKSILTELLGKFDIKKSDFKEIKEHNFKANDFIAGKIDIMTAYLSNELYDIKNSKVPYNIIDPSNYGLFNFSVNVISSKEEAYRNISKTKKFIEATNRGWKYAFKNKKEIIDIIYNKYSKLKSKDALLFESNEIEKLMLTNLYEIGSIKDEMIEELITKINQFKKDEIKFDINEIIFNAKTPKNEILDESDKMYLKSLRDIKLCIDPNWLPFEQIEKGKHIGISKEYMDYFEKIFDIPITLQATKNWSETLDKTKSKDCDIISLVMETPKRKEYMNFTKPYISSYFVIATKNEEIFIPDVKTVLGKKKMAVVKGYSIVEILKNKYKYENIIEVDSVKDGLEMVAKGEIYGFIDCLYSIGYEIQKNFIGELKIAGKFDDSLTLSIGVRKDDVELVNIFNKVIESISREKEQEIFNKWVNVKFEKGTDYVLFWEMLAVFILVLMIVAYRQKELISHNKKIEEQSKALEKKNLDLIEIQTKLKQTLENFETLLNSTMDAIFVVDNNIIIDANQNAINLLAYKQRTELIGKFISSFFEDEFKKVINENLENNNCEPFEISFLSEKQEKIPTLVRVRTTNFEGKLVYILSAIDLREIKYKEMLFFKQSKMAAMGEMIGNIAHQWRQPLSVISAVSTGLKLKMLMGNFDKDEASKSLDNMNASAQYLSQTIDDFRNFYKTDKEKNYISTKSLIDKNVNLIQSSLKASGIELIIDNKCENKELFTYQNELIQAIVNILNNSKDALILNNKENNRFIFLNVYEIEKYVIVCVKDNAGGISEDIIDKIFEPYFTTKHKSNGTGIGLYMTHQIIENHINGKIVVENSHFTWNDKVFEGAKFSIYLPTF